MSSKSMETKEAQKARHNAQMEARLEELKSKGLDDEKIAKDDKIKRFKSKIKQISAAVDRINQIEEQTKVLREKKEKAKAEAETARLADIKGETTKGKKGAKKVEEPEPEKGKGKGKKAAKGKEGQAKAGAKTKKAAKK
jgi:hypothetical protein